MFLRPSYPTYIFFITLAIGVGTIILDHFIRKWPRRSNGLTYFLQALLVAIFSFLIFKISDPKGGRIHIQFPEEFEGPFILLYNMDGYPPIEKYNSKHTVFIPEDGILLTSTDYSDINSLISYEVTSSSNGEKQFYSSYGMFQSSNCDRKFIFTYGVIYHKDFESASLKKMKLFKDSVITTFCK